MSIVVFDGGDINQTVGFAEGKAMQKCGVHQSEDRGVRTDAERESKDGDNSEARRLKKHSEAIAKVLQHTFDEVRPPRIATFFLRQLHSAKLHPRPPLCFFYAQSTLHILLDLPFDVKQKLVVKFTLRSSTPKE